VTADEVSSALEAVVTNFGAMVRRVGWRYRLSDADIDEVMQEVRIRLWRARPTSEQIAQSGASYVYRIAVSAALDLMRRHRAGHLGLAESIDNSGEGLATAIPDPETRTQAGELAEQVSRAIDTIPAARRPVVRMYLAGYPREEIAALLGWSEAKTRNLLYRGLADLRGRLTEWRIGWEASE
jgi:RNA polymerase sigma factor (sigma-70 family)